MADDDDIPLVDELGVKDIRRVLFGGHGRLFSAAGRESPIVEVDDDFLIMHPAGKPFDSEGKSEDIKLQVSKRGVLLDELDREKSVPGAKYKGHSLWCLGERKPGTSKFFVAWFDESGKPHLLTFKGEKMTADHAFRLRNKTHDGELTINEEVGSDD